MSKLEWITYYVVWGILFLLIAMGLSFTNLQMDTVVCIAIITSVFVLRYIYRYYFRRRNEKIEKKVNLLLYENRLDECIDYIDECVKKRKTDRGILSYQAYAYAMCGRIVEFEKLLQGWKKKERYKTIVSAEHIEALQQIIHYFRNCECKLFFGKRQYWPHIVSVLAESNPEKSISESQSLYDTQYRLIKSVLALNFVAKYYKLDEIEQSDRYYEEALQYAPSVEVRNCITYAKSRYQCECEDNKLDDGAISSDKCVKVSGIEEVGCSRVTRNLVLVLFLATIASLWGGLATLGAIAGLKNASDFTMLKNAWVFWCWLPIPILSIFLGYKYSKKGYKCKKNIVAGFIIGALLLLYGSFCLMSFEIPEHYQEMYHMTTNEYGG